MLIKHKQYFPPLIKDIANICQASLTRSCAIHIEYEGSGWRRAPKQNNPFLASKTDPSPQVSSQATNKWKKITQKCDFLKKPTWWKILEII